MDKVLERFIRKHTNDAALYLQAERRSPEHEVLAPARAMLFFKDAEVAADFHTRYGAAEPQVEVALANGQQLTGVPVSPALAREIKDVPGMEAAEDRGRPGKKEKALPDEEPRRMTNREMEALGRVVMKSWQSVPGLKKEPGTAVAEKPERAPLLAGFRREKLTAFLERALGEAPSHAGPDEKADGKEFRLPRGPGGWRRS